MANDTNNDERLNEDICGQSQRLDRVFRTADLLLDLTERAAGELDRTLVTCKEKIKIEGGERTNEYQILSDDRGALDKAGLKQLTAILKDLRDVYFLQSDADTREQEARINKLLKEQTRDLPPAVEVRLGDAESFAG